MHVALRVGRGRKVFSHAVLNELAQPGHGLVTQHKVVLAGHVALIRALLLTHQELCLAIGELSA